MSSTLKNIKVPSELADLVRVYCIFKGKTVTEFTTHILQKELNEFKMQIEEMKQKNYLHAQ